MSRPINLRQVEAFKAVIENGTVSGAAEILHVSQPAISKLIAHLELDTGLKLFDRHKGRLAPTESGTRLYNEIDRVFIGLRQIDRAVDVIRREEQGRMSAGVMPALAGPFIQRATTRFIKAHQNVFCSIESRRSWGIVNSVASGEIDVGIVETGIKNPYVIFEELMKQPAVCVMPLDHPLTAKTTIQPSDLDQIPFVSFPSDSRRGNQLQSLLESRGVSPRVVLVANLAATVCEFVAAGSGIALMHPVMVSQYRERLTVRRFKPDLPNGVALCRRADSRNAYLVDKFALAIRETAEQVAREVLKKS